MIAGPSTSARYSFAYNVEVGGTVIVEVGIIVSDASGQSACFQC